jgi:hypothetical protein
MFSTSVRLQLGWRSDQTRLLGRRGGGGEGRRKPAHFNALARGRRLDVVQAKARFSVERIVGARQERLRAEAGERCAKTAAGRASAGP